MSNITIAPKAVIAANSYDLIKKLPEAAQDFAFQTGSAAAEFLAYERTADHEKAIRRDSAAKNIAIYGAKLKTVYNPKKDQNATYTTWGDFAENVLGVASATFSRLSNVGRSFYLSETETANVLSDMFPPFTLAELLPMADNMKRLSEALEDEELRPDMTQSEVREWVDANREKTAKVEKFADLIFLGDRENSVLLSKWETEHSAPADYIDRKTDLADVLPDGREIPWIQRVYFVVSVGENGPTSTAFSVLYHVHKTPKTGKDEAAKRKPLDPIDILRQSLRRAGFDEDAIEAVLAMKTE